MRVLIFGSVQEFEEVARRFSNCDFFASNYLTYIALREKGVKYLYDLEINNKNSPQELDFLSMNWYRNHKGVDIFFKNEISFAPAITRRVFSSFANDYKNYKVIKLLANNYNSIFLSRNAEPSLTRVASFFSDRVVRYGCSKRYQYSDTASPERTVIKDPSKKFIFFTRLAYIAQFLFVRLLKGKVLVWDDWTYRKQFSVKKGYLISNYFIPWKAFYFPYFFKTLPESQSIFPDNVSNKEFNASFIKNKLKEAGVVWDNALIGLFILTVNQVYKDSYLVLRRTYSVQKKLLLHYLPKTIIFPGETYFSYIVCAQIARKFNVKTVLMVDGYQVIKDNTIFFNNNNNSEMFFDNYVAFGDLQKQLYLKYQNIPLHQIIVVKPVLLDRLLLNSATPDRYEAIIMAYIPHQHNPNSRWDQRHKITIDVLNLLLGLGLKKIAIKIKSGSNMNEEKDIYKSLIANCDIAFEPQLIFGEFSSYLLRADFIVGQVSTALFEAVCRSAPYIVYEPFNNGVPDHSLNDSILINRESVARSISELEVMVRERKASVTSIHNDLISGPSLKDVLF